jgi:hypothetical protein
MRLNISKVLWGIALLIAIWLALPKIVDFWFGIDNSVGAKDSPAGEWIGVMEVDPKFHYGAYEAQMFGDTPGPHKHFLFHVRLDVTDAQLGRYGGKCAVEIPGEGIVRWIKIFNLDHAEDVVDGGEDKVDFRGLANPQILDSARGPWHGNSFEFTSFGSGGGGGIADGIPGTGKMWRGTQTDYDALRAKIFAEDGVSITTPSPSLPKTEE